MNSYPNRQSGRRKSFSYARLESQNIRLRTEVKILKKEISGLKDKCSNIPMNLIFLEKCKLLIDEHYTFGVNNKSKMMEICKVMDDIKEYAGVTSDILDNNITSTYTPEECLKVIDLSGGTLNYRGYHNLRSIEFKKQKRYSDHILPPMKKLKQVSKHLNDIGDEMIPFKTELNADTDMIVFDYKKLLVHILKMHKIYDDIYQRQIEIAITIDGADISKKLSHVTAGIKVIDKYAINPVTGDYILKYAEDSLGNKYLESGYQSRENCFLFLIMIAKESSAIYSKQCIKDFFNFLKILKKMG